MSSASGSGDKRQQSAVRKVQIDEELAGQRIDNFLRRELPGLPRSRLYRIVRRGEVRVNGGRIRVDYRLQVGDEVRVPPVRLPERAPEPTSAQAQDIEQHILYEDGRLLVINKPSGIAVHGGSGVSHGVIERLRAARPALRDLSLAHRLDRATSGCLVLTKKRSALRELHACFRDGDVQKNYLALVVGDWQHGEQTIDAPLLVTNRRGGERHVIVSSDGKPARTTLRLSRTFGDFSLMQCQPETGRTHQIRVHAAHSGHPVAADDRYGNDEQDPDFRKIGLRRLFLHAQSIAFPDQHGNEHHFTAPLTDDLDACLQKLDRRNARKAAKLKSQRAR